MGEALSTTPNGYAHEAIGRKENLMRRTSIASREAFPFYISSCYPPHDEHEKGLQDTVVYEQGQGGAPWVAP